MAPSKNFEEQLSYSLDMSKLDQRAIGPWNVHRLLVAESLGGWTDYMADLEEGLREQVSPSSFNSTFVQNMGMVLFQREILANKTDLC